MTQQIDNLSRLINKYSYRFGVQDLLVLDLKNELNKLQLKQDRLIFSRHHSIQYDTAGKVEKLTSQSSLTNVKLGYIRSSLDQWTQLQFDQ